MSLAKEILNEGDRWIAHQKLIKHGWQSVHSEPKHSLYAHGDFPGRSVRLDDEGVHVNVGGGKIGSYKHHQVDKMHKELFDGK